MKSKCAHKFIKIENIEKTMVWYFLVFTYHKKQKLVCTKCGHEVRP